MKIIYTLCFVLLSYLSYSQDLVRVIDTVLVLDISTQTNASTEIYGSQLLIPPTGKVWKIQSLLLDPGRQANIDFCNPNTSGTISSNAILCFVALDDGINSTVLCSSSPFANIGPSGSGLSMTNLTTTVKNVEKCFENIMWINSSSSIKIGAVNVFNVSSSSPICIEELTVKAHISILEFTDL